MKLYIIAILSTISLITVSCGTSSSDSANGDDNTESNAASSGDTLPENVEASVFDSNVILVEDGSEAVLKDLIDPDKPILVWSWAPWCSNCKAEAPGIDTFAKNNSDVQVIGIGSLGDLESSKEFIDDTGVETSIMVLSENPEDLWLPLGFTGRTENLVVSSDLQSRTDPFSGFKEDEIRNILDNLK